MASGSLHGLLFHTKVSRIEPNLYLGDMVDSQNKTLLLKLGVTHILNMAGEAQCYHPNTFTYKHIPASDHEGFDLYKHLHECADFISVGQRSGGAVFVHCAYGVSRGSSAVISFLIKYRRNSYQEAVSKVQTKRTNASPNLGFVRQLKRFQAELGVRGTESKTLRLIQIEEETEPDYLEEEMNKLSKLGPNLPKGAFRRVVPMSMREANSKSPTGVRSSRGLVGIKNQIAQTATIKALTVSQIKAQQRRDDELAEFRKYVGLQGLGFLHKLDGKFGSPTNKPSSIPKARDAKRAEHAPKLLAGYDCIQCGRILADVASLAPHGKNPMKRCSVVFLHSRPEWFVGDSLGGMRRTLTCPNPRCKAAVGEVCEQGAACCCGFADNPGYTLSLDKTTPFYRKTELPELSKSVQ